MLPFGLHSTPKIFNAVANTLSLYLDRFGIRHIVHYLDNFIFVTPPSSTEGRVSMEILDRACGALGVQITENKRDSLTTCLMFLRVEMDTTTLIMRLL